MPEFDLSLYNATRDRPGGPLVVVDDADDAPTLQPFADASGRWTQGGTMGYLLAYGLLAGGLFYCAYFL